MTMEEIKNSDKAMLTCQDVQQILHLDAHYIRLQARQDASKLGFPVMVYGQQVRIPRLPFIKFLEG